MDPFRSLAFALYHVLGLGGNQPGMCETLRGVTRRQSAKGSQAKGGCPILQVNRLPGHLCSYSLQSPRKAIGS